MNQLFWALARDLGLPRFSLVPTPDPSYHLDLSRSSRHVVDPELLRSSVALLADQRRGVVFDRSAVFTEVINQLPRIKGLHLIRDPRDVLISATHYHSRSAEAWLHTAHPKFDGRTYQQELLTAGTLRDTLLFELRYQTGLVVNEMVGFPELPNIATVTYESLMTGDVLATFDSVFTTLGFSDHVRRLALLRAKRESLVLNPNRRRSPHVRSGNVQQWRERYDRPLAEQFLYATGDALVRLGYESNDAWVDDLPEKLPELDDKFVAKRGTIPVPSASKRAN